LALRGSIGAICWGERPTVRACRGVAFAAYVSIDMIVDDNLRLGS